MVAKRAQTAMVDVVVAGVNERAGWVACVVCGNVLLDKVMADVKRITCAWGSPPHSEAAEEWK
jgi:hypothetical protein